MMLKLSRDLKYMSKGLFRQMDMELTQIDKMLASYIRVASKR